MYGNLGFNGEVESYSVIYSFMYQNFKMLYCNQMAEMSWWLEE
jgi:hypothetical protein